MTQPPSEQPTRRTSTDATHATNANRGPDGDDGPETGEQSASQPVNPVDDSSGERKDTRGDAEFLPASASSAVGAGSSDNAGSAGSPDDPTATAPAASKPAESQPLDFAEIVPRFESALLRYVGQLLRPTDPEVEDIVQDAFLRLHRYVLKNGEGAVRNIQTWLYRVAHNLTMDTLRKRKVRKDGHERIVQEAVEGGTVDGLQTTAPRGDKPSPTNDTQGMDALGQLEHREACQHALDELQRLPEHQKEAVLLKMIQGLTIRQISEITGVSIGNVGYRVNQGLAELSRRLKTAGVI